MATGLVSGKLDDFFRRNNRFKLIFNFSVLWSVSLQLWHGVLAVLSRLCWMSNDRLWSTGFFFRCDACCFADKKPIRLQFCVQKLFRHLVKGPLFSVEVLLKVFEGISCHSFWTGQRLRHASTCWHSFVYSVGPTVSGFELGTLLLHLRTRGTVGLSSKLSFWTWWYFRNGLLTLCCLHIRVHEVEETGCQRGKRLLVDVRAQMTVSSSCKLIILIFAASFVL